MHTDRVMTCLALKAGEYPASTLLGYGICALTRSRSIFRTVRIFQENHVRCRSVQECFDIHVFCHTVANTIILHFDIKANVASQETCEIGRAGTL